MSSLQFDVVGWVRKVLYVVGGVERLVVDVSLEVGVMVERLASVIRCSPQ